MHGQVHYLEHITADVDAVCRLYARSLGVAFDAPTAQLGGARIAQLPNGGLLGVRAPLRDDEGPMCRPYHRVEDLDAATTAARDAGAQVALDGMALGAYGRISIVIAGGIEHGLWEVA